MSAPAKFPGRLGLRGVWRLGIRRKAGRPRRWLGKSHSGTVVEVPPQGRQRAPRKAVRTDCGLMLRRTWQLVRISPAQPQCQRCRASRRWRGLEV